MTELEMIENYQGHHCLLSCRRLGQLSWDKLFFFSLALILLRQSSSYDFLPTQNSVIIDLRGEGQVYCGHTFNNSSSGALVAAPLQS